MFGVESGLEVARENSLLRYFGFKNGRKVVQKAFFLGALGFEVVEKWNKKSFFFGVLEMKVVSMWSEIQFSRTSHSYCKQSSRDPQTNCERLTRGRSLVLHARLVLLQV